MDNDRQHGAEVREARAALRDERDRLALIAAMMLATAFAFGSLLAGLHALRGLF